MSTPVKTQRPPVDGITWHSPIAAGTFGAVFKVLDGTSPAVAKTAKVMGEQALEREDQMLTRFGGVPHCLKKRKSQTGPHPYIVMDRLPVKDLFRSMIEGKFLSFDQWITLAKQGLEFLAAIHLKGYFHGDIKTDNMAFDEFCRYFIGFDFGGAGRAGITPSTHVCQGAHAKSPEIILQGKADTKLDMWSYGCALFELLTGEQLFPVRFIPDPSDTHISDNHHFHMIRDVIGMPTPQFLNTCNPKISTLHFTHDSSKRVIFRKPLTPVGRDEWVAIRKDYLKNPMPGHKIENIYFQQAPWQDRLKVALTAKGASKDQIAEVNDLIGGMICYQDQNRATAAQLLGSPLFVNDIHFHLTLPNDFLEATKSTDLIAFYRASDVQIDQFPPQPAILIDRSIRVTRSCYHLPKDPQDQYIVVVTRGGNKILSQPIQIVPNDQVKIVDTEQGFQASVVTLAAIIQQIYTTTTTSTSSGGYKRDADEDLIDPRVAKKVGVDAGGDLLPPVPSTRVAPGERERVAGEALIDLRASNNRETEDSDEEVPPTQIVKSQVQS